MQNSIFSYVEEHQRSPFARLLALLSTPLLVIALLSLSSCQDGDLSGLNNEALIAATGLISMSVTVKDPVYPNGNTTPPAIMPLGKTQQFDVTGTTSSGDSVDPSELNSQVVWTVSDPSLATIDKNGLLSSIAVGSVTVTASLGSLPSNNTTIDLSAASARSISTSIEGSTISDMQMCNKTQLKASAMYDDDNGTTFEWNITNDVEWTSADTATKAVKIDAETSGLVAYVATPPTDGSLVSTTITATASSIGTSDLALNVLYTAADFTSLTIDQAGPISLSVDSTLQLGATRAPPGDNDDIASITTWTSANPQLVTVDENTGLATAIATGGSTITATCSDKTDTVQITVNEDKTLDYVKIDLTDANSDGMIDLSVGGTKNLKATAFYSDGTSDTAIAVDADADWTEVDISGTNVINIDNSSGNNKGQVTAVTIGSAQVTLKFTASSITATDIVVIKVK